MQVTVTVIDQNGNPIEGVTVVIADAYGFTVDAGVTDANGQYTTTDLPFPDEYGFDHYVITVDFYAATNSATVDWYGEASLTLQLNISNYDIIVVAGQGGTTNPAPGHYMGQGLIYVTAIPYFGYVFDHWNINNVFLTSDTTFHTGANGTFEAFFTAASGTTLSFNASPTNGTLPFTSYFSGRLLANTVGIAGETVILQVYSQAQGAFVDTVFTYQTDSNGNYSGSLSWQAPQATPNSQYQVRMRYSGTYGACYSNTITFTTQDDGDPTGPLDVGITVWGTSPYFNVQDAIFEFKNFIEQNSKLRLNLTVTTHPPLENSEYRAFDTAVFPYLDNLTANTKSYLTHRVNILMFDPENRTLAFGGLAWPPPTSLAIIPLTDANEPPWQMPMASAITHEFLHTINVDSQSCPALGYTPTNDPGWQNCYKYLLSLLTCPAGQHWDATSGTCVVDTPPTGPTNSKITTIKVQDIYRNEFYTWTPASGWDKPVGVTVGADFLYIAVWITNQGIAGNILGVIKDMSPENGYPTGLQLAMKYQYVPAGGSFGIEWTGNMPNYNMTITIVATE